MSQALPDTVHVREVHLLIRQSGFRPKQIILVTTPRSLNAILKQNCSALSSALASDGSQFQAPQNHVKHGDDLGKITADGTKGNLDASTGLLVAKLDVDIELQVPDFPARHRQLLNHFIPTLAAATTERLRLYRIP